MNGYNRPRTEKWKQSRRKNMLGNKNPNWGKSPWCKGKKLSEEHRKKLSDSHIGKPSHKKGIKTGKPAWNKGLKGYDKGFQPGKNHPNWKGGISYEPYSVDWIETLRISIRERDKYTCKMCGNKQGDKIFHVHHINYEKKDCNANNLILLCSSCHAKTNYNREYWKIFLFNKIDRQ